MRGIGIACLFLAIFVGIGLKPSESAAPLQAVPEPGQLAIIQKDGKVGELCPLKGTKVNATISGFGARVYVVQTFTNPTKEPIEAVYTFPLPNDAAVDRMRMKTGSRIIEAEIKRREEARTIYEEAKNRGQVASLLDQERPNIFTQSVANIMPGATVEIEISYAQILKFEEDEFEFSYPMVVGPRFLGNAPDPGKITPPILKPANRSGSTIDLTVELDAGAPIQDMKSVLHQVNVQKNGNSGAVVKLAKKDEIPNRDFILRYRTATNTVQSALITHLDQDKGGFFTLILMPPKTPTAAQIAPKEVIFVMDQSGSQRGFPIDKSKELTLKLIKTMRPGDTFNVIGFSNSTYELWPAAKANTPANIAAAEAFVKKMEANGGTQLEGAVVKALTYPTDPRRLRIVTFNTDGFAGDERKILDSIQKHRQNARLFTFGIGNGVNRYLIDSMSAEGKGDAEYVTLAEGADAAVARFIKRIESPVLTNIDVQFDGIPVEQLMPSEIPDVFSEKPVIVCGRYSQAGRGSVTVKGNLGGQAWTKTVQVQFDAKADAPALPSLWARRKVDHLTRQNYMSRSSDAASAKALNEEVIKVALEFAIMTEFTSFVAVEKKVVNVGGRQRTVAVPVDMADGVDYDATVGGNRPAMMTRGAGAGKASGNAGGFVGAGGGGGGMSTGGTTGTTGGGRTGVSGQMPPGTTAQDRLGMLEKKSGGEGFESDANGKPIYRDKDGKVFPKDSPEFKAAERKRNFEAKVDKKLQSAKGGVEVQVWLREMDADTIAKLKQLGLKVDDKDDGMKILFGSCDALKLADLAQLEQVRRIEPL